MPGARITPDIVVSDPDPTRGYLTGFVNELALSETVEVWKPCMRGWARC